MSLIPESHLDLLTRPVTVSLATVMPDGQLQVTPVWCDIDEEGYLLINTVVGRQKEKNFASNPHVGILAIDPDNPYRWLEVRGVVADSNIERANDHIEKLSWLYRNKQYFGGTVPAERLQTQTRIIYRIQPQKVNSGAGKERQAPPPPPTPPNPNPIIPDDLVHLLTDPIVVTLATVSPSGKPQVTPVWCGYQDGLVWLNTAVGRQKDKNLQRDPRVTILSVNPQHDNEWIEVRGQVVERTTEGAEDHIDQLCYQYSGLQKYFGDYLPAEMRDTMTRVIYKVQPQKVNQDR